MTAFDQVVAQFDALDIVTVVDRVAEKEKFILFIGRATCPYCQRFAPKLLEAHQKTGLAVAFVNSEDAEQLDFISAFRRRYGIVTVPALFVSEKGAAKVVCDSSLSVEDIIDFLN